MFPAHEIACDIEQVLNKGWKANELMNPKGNVRWKVHIYTSNNNMLWMQVTVIINRKWWIIGAGEPLHMGGHGSKSSKAPACWVQLHSPRGLTYSPLPWPTAPALEPKLRSLTPGSVFPPPPAFHSQVICPFLSYRPRVFRFFHFVFSSTISLVSTPPFLVSVGWSS